MTASVTSYLKYLPFVAAIYAVYEAYGQRGISGFLADVKAVPSILNNPAAQKQIIMGIVILIAGSILVSKFAPRGWLKYASYAAIYYFAISMIASAVRSGAGRGGGGMATYQGARRR